MSLHFQTLTLGFHNKIIFKNFTASIQPGEFIGVFGPNGAGKSTLLRAVLGLIKPLNGQVLAFNQPTQKGHPQIGYLPQLRHFNQVGRLSGRTRLHIALNGFRFGLPFLRKAERLKVTQTLKAVEAEDFADYPFSKLSGGEKQRLLLAQALLGEPKLLLLDEPLNNLDPRHQENLIALIQKIRLEKKLTVLFTAHDFNPLLHVMDRIIYLAEGQASIGTVEEVVTSENLTQLYQTPIEVIKIHDQLFVFSQEKGLIAHDTHHHTI